ncbi:MAG: transcription-repair coupling factor [Gemmataceae bacterium]|nr:transcription-repair coupling factor [Gemmataceae bacterium]
MRQPPALAPQRLADLAGVLRTVDGYEPFAQALRAGRSGAVDGTWGSSVALAAATIAGDLRGTLLIVLAHQADVATWVEELASFSGRRPLVFPAEESTPGARLKVLQALQSPSPPPILLASIASLILPVPSREELSRRSRRVRRGDTLDLDEFSAWLVERGYKRLEAVEYPGEFARRGGIIDVFSPDADSPLRLEMFGDEVESIRRFSTQTQRSTQDLEEASVLALQSDGSAGVNGTGGIGQLPADRGHLCAYLPPGSATLIVEPLEVREQGQIVWERASTRIGLFHLDGVFEQLMRWPNVTMTAMPTASVEETWHLHVESVERFSGNVARVRDELDSIAQTEQVLIACQNDAEAKRVGEVLAAGRLATTDRLRLVTGHVRAGFRLVDLGLIVLGSHELFHREDWAKRTSTADGDRGRLVAPARRVESRAIDSFLDLSPGDYVVHVSHGIARYHGMHLLDDSQPGSGAASGRRTTAHPREEHLLLEFRDGVFVYVPASKIDLVQKYVGSGRAEPELSKFGGTAWSHRKAKVEAAVMDLAAEMLELQAIRAAQPGFAFGPDTEWQREFEATFPFRETPDQLTAMAEIKQDLERARPMDRLLCGDVGYGKTELALRAAFKAMVNGKQGAVLVPTTVLAEQHFRTFSKRLAEYPFVVECLSRFRSPSEQKRVLAALAEGSVDVIVGTHRLLSKDVRFKDLGLVIIDEEQRFGVEHKERLKQVRATVHVLTLSATPIPRTLHLALLGLRDISNLETPPPDRLPIETRITRFDKAMIRQAILRELNREGQVYFVHNRVQNIHEIAATVQDIVPEARIVVAHGQMPGHELEQAMLKFVRREADVLVCTTIIESGLDIPNANTIFINQADTYGLADLHQLRGRVGRERNRAYAYLLVDQNKLVTPQAAARLKAIEEFTALGAGFRIAMRDLEIRGAGNILGTQQSGHIAAVGYELYCQLLENAVRKLRHQPLKTHLEVNIDLPWPAYLPREYVPGQKNRLEVYRRLARIRSRKRLTDFRQELRDRFGPIPAAAEWMLKVAELRLCAARWQIESIHRADNDLVFAYRSERLARQLAERSHQRLKVIDQRTLYARLRPGEDDPERMYQFLRHVLRLPDETL